MTEQDILENLQEWFIDRIGEEADNSTNYLESGILDSFDVICLVSHIEKAFDIRLQVEDLQSKEFNTIAGLARLINAKLDRA